MSNLMPVYNNMLGAGDQVMISEENLTEARELIKDKLEPACSQKVCGNCASENIQLQGLKRNKLLAIIFSILGCVPFGNIRSDYYCKDCGWKLS